ncbi:MAG: hypothetical protein ATN36_05815 [Epulopiscium sp. Nele67-Bin005]|nr:MAG: hypothetical protein ATN36_05815 [Epulopiscium sp. Nele67-Bin005]
MNEIRPEVERILQSANLLVSEIQKLNYEYTLEFYETLQSIDAVYDTKTVDLLYLKKKISKLLVKSKSPDEKDITNEEWLSLHNEMKKIQDSKDLFEKLKREIHDSGKTQEQVIKLSERYYFNRLMRIYQKKLIEFLRENSINFVEIFDQTIYPLVQCVNAMQNIGEETEVVTEGNTDGDIFKSSYAYTGLSMHENRNNRSLLTEQLEGLNIFKMFVPMLCTNNLFASVNIAIIDLVKDTLIFSHEEKLDEKLILESWESHGAYIRHILSAQVIPKGLNSKEKKLQQTIQQSANPEKRLLKNPPPAMQPAQPMQQPPNQASQMQQQVMQQQMKPVQPQPMPQVQPMQQQINPNIGHMNQGMVAQNPQMQQPPNQAHQMQQQVMQQQMKPMQPVPQPNQQL